MELSISVSDSDGTTWNLESDIQGQATRDEIRSFIKQATWRIAEEVLKEEQAKGFDKKPRVRTDNKWGKEPREVKFMGKVEYFSRQNIADALLAAYEMVRERSVVDTGQYLMSHYVYLNSRVIARSRGELYVWLRTNESQIKDNDKLRIVNVTPYAARIEIRGIRRAIRGKSKGSTQNMMKNSFGSGIYALAARAINREYKAQGKVKFEVIPNGFGGVTVEPNSRFRTTYVDDERRVNRRNRFSGPYVYPSISFTIAGGGIQ